MQEGLRMVVWMVVCSIRRRKTCWNSLRTMGDGTATNFLEAQGLSYKHSLDLSSSSVSHPTLDQNIIINTPTTATASATMYTDRHHCRAPLQALLQESDQLYAASSAVELSQAKVYFHQCGDRACRPHTCKLRSETTVLVTVEPLLKDIPELRTPP